jgi:hypothetical protein
MFLDETASGIWDVGDVAFPEAHQHVGRVGKPCARCGVMKEGPGRRAQADTGRMHDEVDAVSRSALRHPGALGIFGTPPWCRPASLPCQHRNGRYGASKKPKYPEILGKTVRKAIEGWDDRTAGHVRSPGPGGRVHRGQPRVCAGVGQARCEGQRARPQAPAASGGGAVGRQLRSVDTDAGPRPADHYLPRGRRHIPNGTGSAGRGVVAPHRGAIRRRRGSLPLPRRTPRSGRPSPRRTARRRRG